MKYKGQEFYGTPPLLYICDIISKRKIPVSPREVWAYWQARSWAVGSLEEAVRTYCDTHRKKAVKGRKTASPLTYNEQLKSPRWAAFRERVLKDRGARCERCGSSERLQVHHLRYKRGKLAWQYDMKDVLLLCDRCHARLHCKDSEAQAEERHLQSCANY